MAKTLRLNDQIRCTPVRLIDENNQQRGIVSTHEALNHARDLGLDLVEIGPTEKPPVCRIMDYGKHKYDLKKKQKQQTGHEVSLKEVRLRPKTDEHDRDIKMNRAAKFLSQGHKVQFTMLFRGRERLHRDLALEIFNSILVQFGEEVKVERPPKFEGRRMTMVVAPAKPVSKSAKAKQAAKQTPKPAPKPPAPAPSSEPTAAAPTPDAASVE